MVVIVGLVSERCTGAGHQVVVIISHTLLAAPDTEANDSNTTKKDGTADTSDNTTNDLLVTIA